MSETTVPPTGHGAGDLRTAGRVLVADDHPLVRTGIRFILEGDGFEVREAGDADTAVDLAVHEKPDVCLIDVRMPGDGLKAAHRIAELLPQTAVVMLTVADDDETLFAAVRAGAVGYLLKDSDLERLPEVLRGVLRGEAAVPRSLTTRILTELRRRGQEPWLTVPGRLGVNLTRREAEVLDLLNDGLETAEIARRLFLTPATVRTHVSALLRKFRVPDRDALRAVLLGF